MEKVETKFVELMELLDSEWNIVKYENDIATERKFLPGCDIACFKSTGYVKADPGDLMEYVASIYDSTENMKKHDLEIINYEVVHDLTDDTRLCYQINSLGWPLWPRDLVYLQTIRKEDDAYWIYMYSVESGDKPEQKDKYVRANLNISAYGFIPKDDGSVVHRIAHVDPGGSIPVGIINNYANKTANMIKELKIKFA